MSIFDFLKGKPKNVSKFTMYPSYFFKTFGSTVLNWDNVYENKQNSKALIQNYNTISEVAVPINYYADSIAQVNFLVTKKTQKGFDELTSHWIIDLLKRPNFYQNFDQFISQLAIYRLLLGNAFMAGNVIDGVKQRQPKQLFNLPPQYMSIELDSKSIETDFRINDIKKYILKIEGKKEKIAIEPESILHLKGTNPNFDDFQYLYGLSNLVSCHKNIQAIAEGYSAKVGLYKHGPRVIVTGKNTSIGEAGSMIGDDNLEDIRKEWNSKYGLTEKQFQMLITDIPLDVKEIRSNVKDLAINENNISDFQRICGALNIPSVILSDNSNSTYNNVKESKDQWYNGSFVTFVDEIAKGLTTYFQRFESDIVIKADYSNISEIADAQIKRFVDYKNDCMMGFITRNQYLEYTGQDAVNLPEFNEYYYYTPSGGWVPVSQKNNNANGTD